MKISFTLPAITSRGSAQQGLSVVRGALGFFQFDLSTDRRYLLAFIRHTQMLDLSVDLNDVLKQGSQRLLQVFGVDEYSKNLKDRIERIVQEGILESRTVQSVGMNRPVPIERVYGNPPSNE